MTTPRRPDDARLSTADLATAGERAGEQRAAETNVPPRGNQPAQPAQPAQAQNAQVQPPAQRPPADREVAAGKHANVLADNTAARRAAGDSDRPSSLFAGNESEEFRHRWQDIQTGFVDEPRQAVERADALVASAIKRLAEIFAHERSNLEQQWSRGDDVSTEDLRVALRRYRAFFDRLLSV
jgi:hypothetical protein